MTLTLSQQYPVEMLPIRVVHLTRGQYTIIDPEDWLAVSQHKWYADLARLAWYARRDTEFSRDGNKRYKKAQFLHSFISGFERTDRINNHSLDNRRANLRPAAGKNLYNKHAYRGGSSKFKGVSWDKWNVSLNINGVQYSMGHFTDEEDAARAYDEAARKHHGTYGQYNFPEPGEQPAVRPPTS
jgi:hypothetical protein